MRRAAYRLALQLRIDDVEQWLYNRLSWYQFSQWLDYMELEPFGEERADLRMGALASVIANVNTESKKQRPPLGYSVGYSDDFFIFNYKGLKRQPQSQPKRGPTPEQWRNFKDNLLAFASAKNKTKVTP